MKKAMFTYVKLKSNEKILCNEISGKHLFESYLNDFKHLDIIKFISDLNETIICNKNEIYYISQIEKEI